ncbi:c-type cytochrome [Wenzhouxiangella sp. EGI_FJ10305]|uniref:c-type cytochrome n=1 Tax=Wenzhouxiangella sp. EGI_FJ10305 TaxID=3243768 RepID=UPI0035DC8654
MTHCKQTPLAALLFVALLAGCGEQDRPAENAEPGQAAFGRYCAGCHGMQGQGRPPAFPPLAGSEWLALPAEGLTAIILLGLRGEIEVAGESYAGYMPPMQQIDDERVAEVVRYIQGRWSNGAPDWTAEEVAALRSALAGQRTPEGREGVDRLLEELQ